MNESSTDGPRVSQAGAGRVRFWLVVAPAALLLAQMFLAESPAEWGAYGLDALRGLPGVFRWLVLALGFLALARPAWAHGVILGLGRLPRWTGLALGLGLFVSLRCQNFYLGDGYHLIHIIGQGKLWIHWTEPLDILLHAVLQWVLRRISDLSTAELSYALWSTAAGLLYLPLPGRMADAFGLKGDARVLFVGSMLACGSMQLYFGYAESYTLCSLALCWFLAGALGHLAGGTRIAWPAFALGLAVCLHPETLSAGLGLAYLALRPGPALGRRFLEATAAFALPLAVLILGATLAGYGLGHLGTTDLPGGGDNKMFVAWSNAVPPFEHYTMLSWGHLGAIFNELSLLSPMLLPLLGLGRWRRAFTSSRAPGLVCLGLTALGMLSFVCLWNPDLGPERDWDLFASTGFAFTAFGAALAAASLDGEELRDAAGILPLLGGLLTLASVYGNSIPSMPPKHWRGL